jgi:hypothetical protein
MSCQKILNSLINDVMDLQLMKAGKFKKNSHVFDLKSSIEEIILVHQFKADYLSIKLSA